MANDHLGPLQYFRVQFNKIKAKCKGDPEKLKIYYKNSASFKKLIDELDLHIRVNEFERIFFSKKILKTSKGFAKEWQEYTQNWQNEISICRIPPEIWDALIKDLPKVELTPRELEIQNKRNQSYERQTDKPDIRSEDTFEPDRHKGGMAIEFAMNSLEMLAEKELGSSFGEFHIGAEAKIGLEALEFARDDIGVDFDKIYRRWFIAPQIFFHDTARNKVGEKSNSKIACSDSLNSAIQAFIFGNDLASFAMCRSVLEQVIKVYVPERDDNGNRRDLNQLISVAVDFKIANYDLKKMHKFRKMSNDILHNPTKLDRTSLELERDLLDFLRTLKMMIEEIS